MKEKQKFEKKNNIKTSVTNSQNELISDFDIYNIEKKEYESIRGKNKEAKKRIMIMNDKDELSTVNSKRSNENILLLKKNKKFENHNIAFNNDEYINKFETYFNSQKNIKTIKIQLKE